MKEHFDSSWREMIHYASSFSEWQSLVKKYTELSKSVYGEEPDQTTIPTWEQVKNG